MIHEGITGLVIREFYRVYNVLGTGFLEKVYENAMAKALRDGGLDVRQQWPMSVYFEGVRVGEYFADLVVNDLVIVELKAVEEIIDAHEAQLANYLKASRIEVGLLLNFGPKAEFKRRLLNNDRKPTLHPPAPANPLHPHSLIRPHPSDPSNP